MAQRNGWSWGNLSPLERVMTRVAKQPDGHWMWTGARCGLRKEYGQVMLFRERMVAHRAVWILHKGKIPDGLDLLHQCPFTLCVNPKHLRPGTHKENLAEAVAARGGKHWVKGGELSPRHTLTQSQVDEIRARYPAEKQKDLAAEFNTTQANISYIVNRKKWKSNPDVPA